MDDYEYITDGLYARYDRGMIDVTNAKGEHIWLSHSAITAVCEMFEKNVRTDAHF